MIWREIMHMMPPWIARMLIMPGLLALGGAAAAHEPSTLAVQASRPAVLIKAETAWRQSVLQAPRPGIGCFKAAYPSATWQAIPCAHKAARLVRSLRLHPTFVGGAGTDFGAKVTAPTTAYQMTGSFDFVNGVKSITGGPRSQSNFALQLNSNPFNAKTACRHAFLPKNCLGDEQFIYGNRGTVYIEYWLLNYNNNDQHCPQHWSTDNGSSCYFDSPPTPVPVQPVSNLGAMILTAIAHNGGQDSVTIETSPESLLSAVYYDNVLDLGAYWTGAEFNIVGDENASQAIFNAGSSIGVRLAVEALNGLAPSCVPAYTFTRGIATAESNNLFLVSPCTVPDGSTAITYTEANTPGAASPLITGFSPASGPASGGSVITVSGFRFTGATGVEFGNFPFTIGEYIVSSDNQIVIKGTPPCANTGCNMPGARIAVTGPTGTGYSAGLFSQTPVVSRVLPSGGPPGTEVTVFGNGFYNSGPIPKFDFGPTPAVNVLCTNNGQCSMQVPPAPAGILDVQWINPDPTKGNSPAGAGDKFNLVGPVVTSISPVNGPQTGGTQVELTGTNFTQNLQVNFGGTIIGIAGRCPTSITCYVNSPPGAPTTVATVTVAIAGSNLFNTPTTNDYFEYVAYPAGYLDPDTGPTAGGTTIHFYGENISTVTGATVFNFNFNGVMTQPTSVSCTPAPAGSPNVQQICSLVTPALSPPGIGPIAIPVLVTSYGMTNAIGNFTYTTPPGDFCQECAAEGFRCTIVNGKRVCNGGCVRSGPKGKCQ